MASVIDVAFPLALYPKVAELMTVPRRSEHDEWPLVRGPLIAGYLADAVESFWAAATPLHLVVPLNGDGISAADTALLRLLAEGMTQHDAARRLHMSERTVSRRVADLKQKLEATSAVQAGLEAARRGLI